MADQSQKNRGYLFPNTKKTNPSQPDFRGKLTVKGEEFLLSGWNREKDTEDGKVTMISVEATPASEVPSRQGGSAASAPASSAPAAAGAGASDPDGAVFGDIFSTPVD